MPLKHTYMQVQNTSTNCDFNLDNEQLSPLPKTKTPIQDENTDAEGKKSFVWQYFKTATIDGVLSNICQVNKTPGSVELCLAAPAVNKNKSTTTAQILKGSHTGVSLAEHLIKVLDEFDIHKHIFCITTDNTSNNRTMGVHLAETIPLDNENCLLGCMAHVINLAAQAGIEAFSSAPPPQTGLPGDLANILHDQPPNVEVKTIISWISGLTSFLKHSPTKAKEFATLAAGMKLNCISVFCITHEVDEKYGLEPQLWLKLDQLCDFLAPLKDATRTITPEHSTTLGAAAPIYMMLIN
ncbi:hypothetical protein MJO29_002240 [Puccinia striiformis f. sp. tritici]|nr:hypothetical protein MJO29_002240 [Puccinia striiformis f. sp. tritici]